MSEKDYTHRDLCSSTAGVLQAYLDMAERRDDLDRATVESIAEAFERKHNRHGAETPLPDFDT